MPRIINGEIVPDNDPRINQAERPNQPSSRSFLDQLQEPVTVFGYTTSKQNVLLLVGGIGLFGGFQLAVVAALIFYFGSRSTQSTQSDPRARSVQYATTQGTQTFTNNDNKKPNTPSPNGVPSSMMPQPQRKDFKKVGNITTLN